MYQLAKKAGPIMRIPSQKGNVMTTQVPDNTVPTETPEETPEKKSRFNRKVVGAALAGVAATVAAFVVRDKMKDSEPEGVWEDVSSPVETGDNTTV